MGFERSQPEALSVSKLVERNCLRLARIWAIAMSATARSRIRNRKGAANDDAVYSSGQLGLLPLDVARGVMPRLQLGERALLGASSPSMVVLAATCPIYVFGCEFQRRRRRVRRDFSARLSDELYRQADDYEDLAECYAIHYGDLVRALLASVPPLPQTPASPTTVARILGQAAAALDGTEEARARASGWGEWCTMQPFKEVLWEALDRYVTAARASDVVPADLAQIFVDTMTDASGDFQNWLES